MVIEYESNTFTEFLLDIPIHLLRSYQNPSRLLKGFNDLINQSVDYIFEHPFSSYFVFSVFFIYFYCYGFFYWQEIKTAFFPLPIIGNNLWVFCGYENRLDSSRAIYEKAKRKCKEIIGWFDLMEPVLSICDQKLMRSVLWDNWEYFQDHRKVTSDKDFNSRNLFNLKGEEWKSAREFLCHCFSNRELAKLLHLLIPLCKNFDKYLIEKFENEKIEKEIKGKCQFGEYKMQVNLKELFSRFATDALLTCFFGIEQNSFSEEDAEAIENFKQGQNLRRKVVREQGDLKNFSLNVLTFFKEWLFSSGMFLKESQDHLIGKLNEKLRERKSGNVRRNDLLQFLVDNMKETDFQDDDIRAHLLLFFYNGLESVSTCLSMTALQLAENPHIQEKLFQEINRINVFSTDETEMCFYDRLNKLEYMDCVITESLRRYPVIVDLDRLCTKEFTFTSSSNNKEYIIHPGQRISVPIFGYHRDTQHFIQPNLFHPERHEVYRRNHRDDPNFLAFGAGPRKCLGSRFARMEMKLILSNFLRHFKILASNATPFPMKLKATYEMIPEPNGYIVDLTCSSTFNAQIFYPSIITHGDLKQFLQAQGVREDIFDEEDAVPENASEVEQAARDSLPPITEAGNEDQPAVENPYEEID